MAEDNKINMNILIPMAGAGTRFEKAGYILPKPLIDVNGKPMIELVVNNININANYIFIVRTEHYEKYNLKQILENIAPNCKIVKVDHLTEGAACTCLLAKDYINNNEPLLIVNSDQWIKWNSANFLDFIKNEKIDGTVLTFTNSSPKCSYAKINDDKLIIEIKEKIVISDIATIGIYNWNKGSDFVQYSEQMINKDLRINGEFYVAPIYNEAIKDGKQFKIYHIDTVYGLGTPEDLDIFLKVNVK